MPYYGGTPQAADPAFLMQRLMQGGMSRMQAAAVVGNLQRESNLSTNIINKDEGAYGLMQWRGDRFAALQDFAAKQGKPWTDPGVQADFIGHELGGSERKNAQDFYKAPDLDSATKAFGQGVVRFGDESLPERQANARNLFGAEGITAKATGAAPMVSRETSDTGYLPYGAQYDPRYTLLNSPNQKGIRGGLDTLGQGLAMAFRPQPGAARRPIGSLFAGAAGSGPDKAAAAPSSPPAREPPPALNGFPDGRVPLPQPRPEAAPGPVTPGQDAAPIGGLADFATYRDSVDYGVG